MPILPSKRAKDCTSRAALPGAWSPLFAVLALACSFGSARPVAPAPANMALIPAGTFVAGTDSAEIPALLAYYSARRVELFASETPSRAVRVRLFYMDRTEVAKRDFRLFLLAHAGWRKDSLPASAHNGRYLEDWTGTDFAAGEAMRPVVFITRDAAVAYCRWKGGRLPTEAEWEYAASGGLPRPEFPWGDVLPDSMRANSLAAKLGRTTDVGSYAANRYGLYDMAGNVWELAAERWDAGASPSDATTRFVIKGGSFGGSAINLRVRYRDSHPAGGAGPHVGFRCARDARE